MNIGVIKEVISLGYSPSEHWVKLKDVEVEDEKYTSDFLYPFFAVTAMTEFVGILFNRDWNLELALKSSVVAFVMLFGGFFISCFLIDKFSAAVNCKLDQMKIRRYVGYSSAVGCFVLMVTSLMPELFFVWFFMIYCAYVAWLGVEKYLGVREPELPVFKIGCCAILYLAPYAIRTIMYKLMPGLSA